MKTAMYKERLLALLTCLIRYSDSEHYLNTKDIQMHLLEEYDLPEIERKTVLYDIRALRTMGYKIDSSPRLGYRLDLTPFSPSEIKLLSDLVFSFSNIDDKSREKLITKLYSFTSIYNEKLFQKIAIERKDRRRQDLNYLEEILKAIKKEETLIIRIKERQSEIMPYLLHLTNNQYYLYYSYIDNEQIYHVRFDNIKSLHPTFFKHKRPMRFEECQKIIKESVSSFSSGKLKDVSIKILDTTSYILDDMVNSFDDVIVNKDIVHIKVRISDLFFSKLLSYGDKIKILDEEVNASYRDLLDKVLARCLEPR